MTMKKSPVNDDMGSAKLTKMLRDHENRVKAEATMTRDELVKALWDIADEIPGCDETITEILSAFDGLTAKVNQLESGELYVQLSAERGKVLELTAERDSLREDRDEVLHNYQDEIVLSGERLMRIGNLEEDNELLTTERDNLRALLKRVEWIETDVADGCMVEICQFCHKPKHKGHAQGCKLNAAIGEEKE
jgi:hypothetical protein